MLNINENTLDAYKQKTLAQVKEMKAKMQLVEANSEKTSADIRIKYQKYLDDWKSRFKDIEMRLDNLSNSAEESWDEIRSGIDNSISELRNTIANVSKQFNN